MSDSSRPHGLQPTRLLCPWDFPGKSTGIGCHCLLHMCVCVYVYIYVCIYIHTYNIYSVAKSCLNLCEPKDCSPPGSSIHGILQARVPEWGAIAFSNIGVGPALTTSFYLQDPISKCSHILRHCDCNIDILGGRSAHNTKQATEGVHAWAGTCV